MAATETREAAPLVPLGSQMQISNPLSRSIFNTPIVTKDELIEGNKLTLNANDKAAKDFAVQSTLNKLKGVKALKS